MPFTHTGLRACLLLLCAALLSAAAPPEQTACYEQVRAIYARMNLASLAADTPGCRHLRYRMELRHRRAQGDTLTQSRTDMWLAGPRAYIASGENRVYQDAAHIVLLMPEQQSVVIRKRGPQAGPDESFTAMYRGVQDSIFAVCQVEYCGPAQGAAGLLELRMRVRPAQAARQDFRALRILADPQAGQIRELSMEFKAASPLHSMRVVYEAFSLDAQAPPELNGDPLRKVLTARGTLLPPYTKFRLLDLRSAGQ